MEENDYIFLIKVVKSVFGTIVMALVSMMGIYSLVNLAFKNMSVEQSDSWLLVCLGIGIIFTMFFCTFTILDEIKKKT